MTDDKKNIYYVVASFLLVAFMVLGYVVKFYEPTLSGIDGWITTWIREPVTPFKSNFFLTLTKLGNTKILATLLAIIMSFTLLKKRYVETGWLFINVALLAGLGNLVVKYLFNRPRPLLEHLVFAPHSSFPSGHAMGSVLMYGTLIVFCQLWIKHHFLRYLAQASLLTLILLIGASRIYAGVHFPTDILGGYLLGSAWLMASYPIFIRTRFIARFTGKQH